jgi:hypothetical protein
LSAQTPLVFTIGGQTKYTIVEPLRLVIPTEIEVVFEEVETPRQLKQTGGVWLLLTRRKAHPTPKTRIVAAAQVI